MRTSALFSLTLLLFSVAQAQELSEEAPLEFVKPSAVPLDLTPPPLPPPPKPAPKKRAPKKAIEKVVTAPVPAAPVVAPATPPAAPTGDFITLDEPAAAAPAPAPAPSPSPSPSLAPPAPVVKAKAVKVRMPPMIVSDKPYSAKVERLIRAAASTTRTPSSYDAPAEQKTVEATAPVATAPAVAAPVATPVTSAPIETHHSVPPGGTGRKKALKNFRVANIWAVKGSSKTGSFIGSWAPVLRPYERFNFGITLGATILESEAVPGKASDTFWVYEYGATASYYVSRSFLPELVIGAQTWNDKDITNHLMLAGNANFLFRERPYRVMDRAYVGYAMLAMDDGYTHVFRAGVGFRF